MHSLGIVQWNSTRRDHPGNPGGVSGSGLVIIGYHGVVRLDSSNGYTLFPRS